MTDQVEIWLASGKVVRMKGKIEMLWASGELRVRDEHGRYWYFLHRNIEMYRTI